MDSERQLAARAAIKYMPLQALKSQTNAAHSLPELLVFGDTSNDLGVVSAVLL